MRARRGFVPGSRRRVRGRGPGRPIVAGAAGHDVQGADASGQAGASSLPCRRSARSMAGFGPWFGRYLPSPTLRRARSPMLLGSLLICSPCLAARSEETPRFERHVIDPDFPGAYQVEVADVDGDGKPDIVAVGGGTCAWYQNPSWKKRVVTGPKQTP